MCSVAFFYILFYVCPFQNVVQVMVSPVWSNNYLYVKIISLKTSPLWQVSQRYWMWAILGAAAAQGFRITGKIWSLSSLFQSSWNILFYHLWQWDLKSVLGQFGYVTQQKQYIFSQTPRRGILVSLGMLPGNGEPEGCISQCYFKCFGANHFLQGEKSGGKMCGTRKRMF